MHGEMFLKIFNREQLDSGELTVDSLQLAWFAMSCFLNISIGNNSLTAEVLGVVMVISFGLQGCSSI
jgi:hypothetical protein